MCKAVDTIEEVKGMGSYWKVGETQMTQIFIQSEKDGVIKRLADVTYGQIKDNDTIKSFTDLNTTYIETWGTKLVFCLEDGLFYSANYRLQKSGEEVAGILNDFVNSSSHDNKAFADKIVNSHRTLQQGAFTLFTKCIEAWAGFNKKGYYDDRNKATVELSAKIWDTINEEYIPFI